MAGADVKKVLSCDETPAAITGRTYEDITRKWPAADAQRRKEQRGERRRVQRAQAEKEASLREVRHLERQHRKVAKPEEDALRRQLRL